jgi:hypothetical protein
MKKKITQEEWFAAASAQDLWAVSVLSGSHIFSEEAIGKSNANQVLFNQLFKETEDEFFEDEVPKDICDQAFLAAQIGCEKAGL